MLNLPSNRVLGVFIITTSLVFSIIIVFGKEKSTTAINFTNNLVAGKKISIPENTNWKGELNDLSSDFSNTEVKEEIEVDMTDTDKISQTFMSNYLALKQNNNLNQESVTNLVNKTVDLVTELGDEVVLDTSLNVISDNGKSSMVNYGENLGNVLRNNKPKNLINELEIISNSVSSRDNSKIGELDNIIVYYNKIADQLIKMPVPKTFVKAHLDMVNGVKGVGIALMEMRDIFNDPFKGLGSLELYQKGKIMFTEAKRATNNYIIKSGISYEQGSGGYFLLYGI